jgi:hypothetical protein
MNFPFVSRARYADREREILELRRELAEARHNYERVTDEINFRSTGFHLYERFVKKDEPQPAIADPAEEEEEPTGIAAAIHQVGTRPTALRQYLESTASTEHQQKEKAYDQKKQAALRAQAADALEQVLERTKPQAQA